MLLEEWQSEELKRDLIPLLNEKKLNADLIAEIINPYLGITSKLIVQKNMKLTSKILLTTGAGNTIQGGADIWVNNFLEHVWPNLPYPKTWKLLIDSKRPAQFEDKSLPKGLKFHFHGDNPEITKQWLEECIEIHSLHSHYHKRDHIWDYEDKFKTVFVHAYPKEMNETIYNNPELKRLQYNTNVDAEWFDEYIATFKKRIWIGCNPTSMFEEHPNYSYTIPNYYEFTRNLGLSNHIDNGKVGFASRAESRKCLHWLHNHEGLALTSQFDVKNLKDTTTYSLPNIDIYQWDPNIYNNFMTKNWGIFHGAYFKEPFGYSIFQAVDYGKLPIIHKDWIPEIQYKYRAGTINEFSKIIKQIKKDSQEERLENFNRLKEYLKKYDNKNEWADKIRTMILD
jgi:hypothetical protein